MSPLYRRGSESQSVASSNPALQGASERLAIEVHATLIAARYLERARRGRGSSRICACEWLS